MSPGDLVIPRAPGCLRYLEEGSSRSEAPAWMVGQGAGVVIANSRGQWVNRVQVLTPWGPSWCYVSSIQSVTEGGENDQE